MITASEMRDRVLSKADADREFRARLIADPKAAIADEIGQPLPQGFDIVIHEDSDSTSHIVLPPAPSLTEAELEMVAGAAAWMNAVAPRDPNTGGKPK